MPPYLVPISDEQFAKIPERAVPRTIRLRDPTLSSPDAMTWILDAYLHKFLVKNAGFEELLKRCGGDLDSAECRAETTAGQRILYSLAALNGQVNNGGVAQFLWNVPQRIFPAADALALLGETDLAEAYERVLQSLLGKKEDWQALRNKAAADPGGMWKSFEQTYELLDVGWFDDAYFERYGPRLVARLVAYVQDHKQEFVTVPKL